MCPLSKRPLSNVHPAAVLRPSGMVVSTQCVKDCIKKDMIDPFTEPPASCALGRLALPSPALPCRNASALPERDAWPRPKPLTLTLTLTLTLIPTLALALTRR